MLEKLVYGTGGTGNDGWSAEREYERDLSRWVPDGAVDTCPLCNKTAFGVLWNRRHHCRMCGLVICAGCRHSWLGLDSDLFIAKTVSRSPATAVCRRVDGIASATIVVLIAFSPQLLVFFPRVHTHAC